MAPRIAIRKCDRMANMIRIKRIYAPQEPEDGARILVDRIWPRGIKKENADLRDWVRNIAPSTEIRKSFSHRPERFAEFREAYIRELEENGDALLFARFCAKELLSQNVTLLYAAKDETHNNACVLCEWICITIGAVKDLLKFDSEKYTIKEAEREGIKVRYRAFENILYCSKPVLPEFQSLSLYVPEEYYHGAQNGRYSLHTAPIFMPNTVGGYKPGRIESPGVNFKGETNAAFAALARGFVVVSPAARGRGLKNGRGRNIGNAPSGLIDLKAAVRYLRHNKDVIPGNTERIITNGTSAGGAMSALLGSTGNCRDYDPFLLEIGAADERDDVFAASCYCPITDLDHADMAYEWEFGGRKDFHCMKPEFEVLPDKKPVSGLPEGLPKLIQIDGQMPEERIALSLPLKAAFPAYLNALGLKDGQGRPLVLDGDGNGSFKDFVKHYVLKSINRAAEEGLDLSGFDWIFWKDGIAEDFDFGKYVDYRTRMKETPAFDNVFEHPTAENEVFGTADRDCCHFTEFGMQQRKNDWPPADPEIVRIMNPMNYIGSGRSVTAKYFRIRHGASDRDTSLAVSAMLTAKLRNNGTEADYHLPWGLPHSGDYDLAELFQWIEEKLR